MISYDCLICKKLIDDYGNNFCSKCRNKDWKQRLMAIQRAEKIRKLNGKTTASKNFISHIPNVIDDPLKGFGFRTYWERRRNS